MQKIKCLSEIYLLIEQLPKPNQEIIKKAKEYQNQLTKPQGSLGILEDLSIFFCGWQNNIKPSLKKIQTLTALIPLFMASNNSVSFIAGPK